MAAASDSTKPPVSFPKRVFDFFSGFGLATILILLLGILTWLATLEQVEKGLYPTLLKYFDLKAWYVIPELKILHIGDRPIKFPLPGGYWVCTLLFVNLLLGGILRARRGWRHVGVLISHCGILFMLVAGGVAHWMEERGNMAISEGETSDFAEDYIEYVIEVAEIKDGKPTNIQVIRKEFLGDLTGSTPRKFLLPQMPFDLEINGWLENSQPIAATERAPEKGEYIADGYYLAQKDGDVRAEANTAGIYARVAERDGTLQKPFILAGASFYPYTLRHGDRVFTIDMRKRLWPMPFKVRLEKFTATFHPGTSRPESFSSKVVRIEDGHEIPATIQMNEPMRYKGLTFFQASYGPQGAAPGAKLFSVFEVVSNPSDQWPKYSLCIVALGLALHFILKLVTYTIARFKS